LNAASRKGDNLLDMELLERGDFLQTLGEYAREARQGSGRLVFVAGESGIGKTALLEELQRDTEGVRFLWGACDGLLTPRPLGPVFDIAAQTGGNLADACREEAPRERLFTAFLAELDAPGVPTIALIEDVHWADEASIDLLRFLGRRISRASALVVATFRDDTLADDHPLRLVMGDLATQRSTRRVSLPPLSVEAVRTLAEGSDLDPVELHAVTGGNPFYVSEVLEAGLLTVPHTVRDAVGARLARSSPEVREVVEVASVMGARVDASALATIVPGTASIDECLSTGILRPDGAALRFRHELVRMAVEGSIPAGRTAELHGSVLAVLETRGESDRALLAHHAEAAGDGAAVLRHAPLAAQHSSALGAHREAAAQYERALRFADGLEPAALAPLYEGLALERSLLDQWEEAEEARRAALELRRAIGDDLRVGENLYQLSKTLWRLCRGEEGAEAAEDSVRVLESLPRGKELAWAYAGLSAFRMEGGDYQAGIDLGEKARALGEELGEIDVVSYALNSIGCALFDQGETGEGLDRLERSLAIALEADLQEAAGRAYCNARELTASVNRFAESERFYADGMAYCEPRELGVFSSCLTGGHAVTLMLLGRWGEAERLASEMLHRRNISPVNKLTPLIALGTIRARRGEAQARELLDEGVALAEGVAEPQWIAPTRGARAEFWWLSDQHDLALEDVRSIYPRALGRVSAWAMGPLALWLHRLGAREELPPDLPEPFAMEIGGDWRAAAATWERVGRPYDAALTKLVAGDEAGLREALTSFDGLGAQAAAGVARARLRELGAKGLPRGPRAATRNGPAGLTAREQEVLALMSEGLANREISKRLFISERTVDHHVSAVLSKIGVSSRTAAAREAARLGIVTAS
jgi:DNA-binding CsgD family transcriptional regulator/tetratricopeptide (TPR) repeat protein